MKRKTEAGLVQFLRTKRWFGDKGRDIRGARLRDAIPVEWPGSRKGFAVGRVEVTTDEGVSTYQLFMPLAKNREPKAERDALEDPDFLRGLADACGKGATFEHDGGGARWIVANEGKARLVVPPNAKIALAPGEQTNSSVIMNREGILKLFRKLEPGVHPDVEVTRFLTIERRFVNVPVLMGTIRFEDAEGVTVAGMLQEYVQAATDAWTYFVETLVAKKPLDKATEQLGAVTRALHEHLASGDPGSDFDQRRATREHLRSWQESASEMVTRAIGSLSRALSAGRVSDKVVDLARVVIRDRDRYLASIADIGTRIGDDIGSLTRTHGDLHLGQVLRSATGQFLIIDFEGEPTRPLSERRQHTSPLRDVAGMLQSFGYAAAVAAQNREDTRMREHELHAAFRRGYFTESRRPALLPGSRENADLLLELFRTEKSFYELQYELDHRPDWLWIPLVRMPLHSAP